MNVLYVVDSTTVSGAEHVMLQYLQAYRPPRCLAHVFLDSRNRRLRDALCSLGIDHTVTSSFSRRLLQTTANPVSAVHFARAFWRVSSELKSVIRAREIDLVHSISYPTPLYVTVAIRRTGVPQVWHEHNIKRRHAVNSRLYRFAASTCPRVVGPSGAVIDNLARFGIPAFKLKTVYNGIDLSKFEPDDARALAIRRELGLSPGQPAIALLGQMLRHKGHRTLIEAVAQLGTEFPTLRAFFVGALENPPYEAELEQAIRSAQLTDAVRFIGWRGDAPHVIRAMDVVVVATTTPEPAALALMETMAMGRPVVATRTGGTAEIVEDGQTGVLFPPGNAADLAGCLRRLLRDEQKRAQMGCAGRARVEQRFTMGQHLDAMSTVYEEAIQSDRRGLCAFS